MRLLKTLSLVSLASISVLANAQYAGSTKGPADLEPGFEAIKPELCKTWLSYLAGPECQGRGTGQPGFQKAAEYMAARFKEFGLKPIGDSGTYFQNVPFVRSRIDPAGSFFEVEGKKVSAKAGLSSSSFAADSTFTAPIVFLKIAGDATEVADAGNLEGKVVVVVTKSSARGIRRQLNMAGAKAVFYVAPKAESAWYFRTASSTPRSSGRLSGEMSQKLATELAKAVGVEPEVADLASSPPTTVDSREGIKPAMFFGKVETQKVNVPNVVGLLEGSDPTLKSEVVGVGAHLDHLGNQNGTVYWGADDDGSGSTAILAIAKAFSANPVKPKRSILFMAFCGEEMGLIGSGWYANHPILPLDKMTCELQLDMVGRNEESQSEKASDNIDTIHLVGSKRISTELHETIMKLNEHVNFKFEWDEEDVYTRSDHYNFAAKGVPIAFLFDGFHPDYHQPTDTIEKINFDKISNAARLFYLVAHVAADKPEMMKRDVGK